jgi:hypothetical protein
MHVGLRLSGLLVLLAVAAWPRTPTHPRPDRTVARVAREAHRTGFAAASVTLLMTSAASSTRDGAAGSTGLSERELAEATHHLTN